MTHKAPRDIDGDGKISQREKASSMLGNSIMEPYDPKKTTDPQKLKDYSKKRETEHNIAGVDKRTLDMFEHDSDEVIVSEIKKHPIGLFAIWLMTFAAIALLWALIGALLFFNIGGETTISSQYKTAGIGIGLCLSALALLFGYIAAFLYVNNRLILTNEKLVQIRYYSLFNRKVSSLSIGDVQDTTVKKNGFLPMMFNYGTIVIETSGEQANYDFPLAINAEENAKLIVQYHEENLHSYGN